MHIPGDWALSGTTFTTNRLDILILLYFYILFIINISEIKMTQYQKKSDFELLYL